MEMRAYRTGRAAYSEISQPVRDGSGNERLEKTERNRYQKLEFGCLADNPDRKMRMKEFVEQVGNPYCFLVGDIVVKSTFTEGAGLKQRLQELAEGL